MKRFSILVVLLLTPLALTAHTDYEIRFLQPGAVEKVARLESQPTTDLAGKEIAAIFGPIAEIRLEWEGTIRTPSDGDPKETEARLRTRLDHAQCLGRVGEVPWHQAPWARGHLLLKNGRIVPVQMLLSGIVVGDLLFDDSSPPIRARDALAAATALLRQHHADWGPPERVLRTGANWYRIEYRKAPEGSERVVLVNPDNGQAEFPMPR